jgi:hypothetical protein
MFMCVNALLGDAYHTGAECPAKACAPSCGMKPIHKLCSSMQWCAVLVQSKEVEWLDSAYSRENDYRNNWH